MKFQIYLYNTAFIRGINDNRSDYRINFICDHDHLYNQITEYFNDEQDLVEENKMSDWIDHIFDKYRELIF